MTSSYIGAYWGNRQESAAQCADRLAAFLRALGAIDASLAAWFRKGGSKAIASAPVALDAASLQALVEQGRKRRDVGGDSMDELGFSVGLWNRASPEVGLGGTVGAYPSFTGVLNNVVLQLPRPEGDGRRLYAPAAAEEMFGAIVQVWEPDWVTWTSHALRNAQSPSPREPVVGWMTYLSGDRATRLPTAASRPLMSGAVVTTDKSFSEIDERSVLALRQQLHRAQALQPTP